jgi:signal transduction histidine kinase
VIGFLAAVVPLVVLLTLQYRWLLDLQKTSRISREAALENYVEAIVKEVHYFYVNQAERALNLPAELFTKEAIQKAGYHFKKKHPKGAKDLFVVSFLFKGGTLFYDPETHAMVEREWKKGESLAAWAVSYQWQMMQKRGGKIESPGVSVSELDPGSRIIVNPITDENSQLVGLAGMFVDQEFFECQLLPKAIQMALPKLKREDDLVVVVRDERGRPVLPGTEFLPHPKHAVKRAFSFVFKDWTVSLQGNYTTPEEWAKTNFAYNVTLSVVLSIVLIGGIVLALRTALKEITLSEMKNDFVSNVSHELRTPLSSIRVFGEFMRLGRVDEPAKVREYGGYIESESRRLTQLINNILDFSRIESGQKVYTFEKTDVEEVVQAALETFAVRLRDSGFEIDYDGPEEVLPSMRLDAGALDQAICNLLDNAVKYSGEGRQIEVNLRREDGAVAISVKDSGIGIEPEEQELVFQRFHRVSTGLVHDVKGSGLGLSLVQHIVEAHGGRVWVDSEPGKGSTFTMLLPLAEAGTETG